MSKRLKSAARNPILILLPFVAAALTGWAVYMHILNAPSHAQHNLLTSSSDGGIPRDWKVRGISEYVQIKSDGYKGGKAFGVRIKRARGSLDIQTPMTPVRAGEVYIYKSYHKASVPFSLLIKYSYENGTSRQELVKQYGSADRWTTDSFAFRADNQSTGVQVQYSLADKGDLLLSRPYLEQRSVDVFIAKDPAAGKQNLLKDYDLSKASDDDPPSKWSEHKLGNNDANFSSIKEDGAHYLRIKATKFKNGEAGWQSNALTSAAGQYTAVSVDYRSSVSAHLVASYALSTGETVSLPIAELPPASQWTTAHSFAEAPEHATKVSASVMLWSEGTVDTRDYQLKDITKEGERHFQRPLVSIIFTDGWASTYVTASRIMSFLSYKGTFYVSPSSIGQPGFINESQAKQLLRDNHQLGAGSYEQIDLATLNTLQLNRQLKLASGYFRNNLNQADIDFLPPYGHSDPEVQAVTRKYFHSSVSGGEGLNTKQTFDSYNLKTLHVDKTTQKQRVATALNEAKDKNGWLILAYDRVEDNSGAPSAVTSKAFTDQMEQVYKSKISVVTISQGLEEDWGQ
jgi:peptidoglycan/xylan/chitin deacetylase (PgdA/CDA1 family)